MVFKIRWAYLKDIQDLICDDKDFFVLASTEGFSGSFEDNLIIIDHSSPPFEINARTKHQ